MFSDIPTDQELASLALCVYSSRYVEEVDVGSAEYCLVLSGTDTICIGVRGTELSEPVDLLRDLQFRKVSHSQLGKCHRGFYKGASKIFQDLMKRDLSKRHIYIAGHSKGGAEATILAGLLALQGCKVARLVTFGSPRCATLQLQQVLVDHHTAIHRYVNKEDRVPGHPWRIFGYHHVGRSRVFPSGTHAMADYIHNIHQGVYPAA